MALSLNNYNHNSGGARTGGGYGPNAGGARIGGGYSQNAAPRDLLPDFKIAELNKDLLDVVADKCARTIKDSGGKDKNKSTQLRRFYDELVMWEERASVSENAYKNAEPFIFMIKSKVAYSEGRGHIDANFKRFMDKLIDQIKDRTTLKNAKLFMEAMMGFYKFYKDGNKDEKR